MSHQFNPNDLVGNAAYLCCLYGFSHESEVPMQDFTINGVKTHVGPGKYKSTIFVYHLYVMSGCEEDFVVGGIAGLVRQYFGDTVCDNLGGHPTVAALLSDSDVVINITLKDRREAEVNGLWERRTELSPQSDHAIAIIESVIADLDTGKLRIAEKVNGDWIVNQWLKKAVLLSFRTRDNRVQEAGDVRFYDKVDTKFQGWSEDQFKAGGFRVVPGAFARKGAFIAKNVVLMPSFVNIGAYVDEGTMVDTWATVGSCAQIGKNVHLSGGVGIGGVLEPIQAGPVIIEDNCFIGARSEVVEGVVIEENSVIGMGVYLGQSTPIYDRATGEISYGRVPSGSVVVSGTLPKGDGAYSMYAAIIVKRVDAQTRSKTSINELLRP